MLLAQGILVSASAQETTASAVNTDHWMDHWHRRLESSMNLTAKELDEFFAAQHDDSHKDARAFGRIRIGWEPRTREFNEFDVRFRVRVRLPALKNRVDLLLSDDEDDLQENSVKAARNAQLGRRDQTTLALRFRESEDAHFSHRIGAGRRDQLFYKTRYRNDYDINQTMRLYYDAELYYYTRDRLGAEVGLSFQQLVSEDKVWRLSNRYYYRDISDDWRWRHEAQFLHQVDAKTTYVYTAFIEGLSQPNMHTEQVFFSTKWRSNPMRDWLFFEVEPFILLLKDESFSPSYGLAMRFEVLYGKR
ncbi:hypothetical protein KIU71_06445 [Alteromonas sp. SM 2104]|nr:hypothetical protein [Alteromonas oceanisediminis]